MLLTYYKLIEDKNAMAHKHRIKKQQEFSFEKFLKS